MSTPVLDLFLAQALKSPGTVALVVGRRSLTYGELERASAELAGRLRAHGAGRAARSACTCTRVRRP